MWLFFAAKIMKRTLLKNIVKTIVTFYYNVFTQGTNSLKKKKNMSIDILEDKLTLEYLKTINFADIKYTY